MNRPVVRILAALVIGTSTAATGVAVAAAAAPASQSDQAGWPWCCLPLR